MYIAPLVPKDITVRGFIIDSETGALEEVKQSTSKDVISGSVTM